MERLTAIILLLRLSVLLWMGGHAFSVPHLRRHKRDWILPSIKVKENFDFNKAGPVARIRSDYDKNKILHYTLQGPGANEEPLNRFTVDQHTGLVYIQGTLDREEKETYILTGLALFSNGSVAEGKIDLSFEVEDENDNPPVFVDVPPATVIESSPAGTLVGVVKATDADKANYYHSKIAYSIEKQEPSDGRDLFYIDRESGTIYVKENTTDREKQSSYILTVKGIDMDGAPRGNTATATIYIRVLDINDNPPKLEKYEYACSIVENTADVEVMRFKTLDADEERTDNWLAVFDIVTGNEDGIFSIKTDPHTNEGILLLVKPVDFEANPDIHLGVAVSNVAPNEGDWGGDEGGQGGGGAGGGGGGGGGGGAGAGAGAGEGGGGGGGGGATGATGATGAIGATGAGAGTDAKTQFKKKRPTKGFKLYPVNIAVLNEIEGVAFKPSVKPVSVSENPKENPLKEVIAVYTATDVDTEKPAKNVRYVKGYDPENWLLIDSETAEIRLQKAPDRESPYLVNGTYYAKILSMTEDNPPKMSTGTIALQVGDVNDNCPTLTKQKEHICSDTEILTVTAVDSDGDPNSAPFNFLVVSGKSQGEWRVEPLNGTSTSLRTLKALWPGHYQVVFIIEDQQGLVCPDPQYLDLHVCSCEKGETCTADLDGRAAFLKESSSTFGGLGVGAPILGFFLLLVVGLLLMTCSCKGASGTFTDLPFDTKEHLMVYHIECRGENKDVPLLRSPVHRSHPAIYSVWASNADFNTTANTAMSFVKMGTANKTYNSSCWVDMGHRDSRLLESQREQYSMFQNEALDGIALSDVFLHQYYSEKASCIAEKQAARDCLLEYDYEGRGSSAGSVSCCSPLESDNDLHFLDDLESKFKTLAEICSPPKPPTTLIHQSIVPPEVDTIDHVAGLSLEIKANNLCGKSLERNQDVGISQSTDVMRSHRASTGSMHGQTSNSVMGFNGTASSSQHRLSSHSIQWQPQSPLVSPVSLLPSPVQVIVPQQQQPVYYISSTVMQPMNYIAQPQLQSTMLLAEVPVSSLQTMILYEGNTAGSLPLGTNKRRQSGRVGPGRGDMAKVSCPRKEDGCQQDVSYNQKVESGQSSLMLGY